MRLLESGVLEEYVRQIVKNTDPDVVVLFGSQARGTMTADSDVDILVVHPGPRLRRIQRTAYESLRGHSTPVDIIVRSPEDMEGRLAWSDPFITNIVNEGRVLYGKPSSRGMAIFSRT